MASTTKSDADGILIAFDAEMGGLFKVLSTNLVTKPTGPDEKQYVAAFAAGYAVAKHARDLALGVLASPEAEMMSADLELPKAPKKKKR